MPEQSKLDVVVIGAGIGGYVAAIRSAQLGKTAALIEKDRLGGTCLNWGCIPTKALLATADFIYAAKRSEELGVTLSDVTVDISRAMARKDAIVNRLTEGVRLLVKKNGIIFIEGKGTLLSRSQVGVQKPDGARETIEAGSIVIAAGSEEPKLSFVEVDEEKILTSKGALTLTEVPKSFVVVGGGAVGIEFAMIFNALGAHVRLLESLPNLLHTLDADIGRTYQRVLKKKGVEVHLNTEVKAVKLRSDGKVGLKAVQRGSALDMDAEKVLVSGRRSPLITDLGLEKIGVQVKDGFVPVDAHQKTSVPNIYAVGDVTGGKMLAHVAMNQGVIAAENIAGLGSTFDPRTVPTCVYSQPEVASVGLSEDEAKEQGHEVAVGKTPLLASGRALTLDETEGLAKVVCDAETGEILGVHLVAPHATELIGEATLAMRMECTSEEIGALLHAHPTISEALMEAARAISKKAIHM